MALCISYWPMLGTLSILQVACFQELQYLTVDTDGDLLDSSVRALLHEMVPNANLGCNAFDGHVWGLFYCMVFTMGFHFGTTARFLWAIPLKSPAVPSAILLIFYFPVLPFYEMTLLCL